MILYEKDTKLYGMNSAMKRKIVSIRNNEMLIVAVSSSRIINKIYVLYTIYLFTIFFSKVIKYYFNK